MIEASCVTLSLAGRTVLHDVSLRVGPGELIALVGPNGAGKSSLLRLLAGSQRADFGTVSLAGAPLPPPRDRARRVALLPQGASSAWGMTVRQVVALGRLPHGDENPEAIARAIAACDLTALSDRRIDQVSGGEARRAMLARVLATEARVLLLDEPASDLDPAHGFALMRILRAEAQRGAAILVVLHDLALAARFCDRMALLDRGRLVADANPATIMTDSLAGATFGVRIGVSPMPVPLP